MAKQAQYGNQWAIITSFLPGRTDMAVKNRWHTCIRSASRRTRKDEPEQTLATTPMFAATSTPLPDGSRAAVSLSSTSLRGSIGDITAAAAATESLSLSEEAQPEEGTSNIGKTPGGSDTASSLISAPSCTAAAGVLLMMNCSPSPATVTELAV